jgi:hypothetical protein
MGIGRKSHCGRLFDLFGCRSKNAKRCDTQVIFLEVISDPIKGGVLETWESRFMVRNDKIV